MIATHFSEPEEDIHTFLYYDMHGEYPVEGFTTLINSLNLSEVLGDSPRAREAIQKVALQIGYSSPETIDEFGFIVGFRGTHGRLDDIFHRYMNQVGDGPQGADDDTFDYWPGAIQLAHDIAKDLDAYYGSTVRQERLAREVDEWYTQQEEWLQDELKYIHEDLYSHRADPH